MEKISSQILSLQDLRVEEVSYAEETTNSLLQAFPKIMSTWTFDFVFSRFLTRLSWCCGDEAYRCRC
jgi:hypothetical protein